MKAVVYGHVLCMDNNRSASEHQQYGEYLTTEETQDQAKEQERENTQKRIRKEWTPTCKRSAYGMIQKKQGGYWYVIRRPVWWNCQ
jgi:hypothetical protein